MVRTRFLLTALVLMATLGVSLVHAEEAVKFKNFVSFQGLAPGVDFFAAGREDITQYEKATTDAIARLKPLLGNDLPKGAIFICSSLEQKDSLYEPVVLKRGYAWVLISIAPEVRMQENIARIKSRIGDNIPPEMLERMKNPPKEMLENVERMAAGAMTENIAFAIIQTMMNGANFNYRSSRVTDVYKSPLPDWLDVGIALYASNNRRSMRYLVEHLDQAFSIEDVISMSRPFVASDMQQGGGNGGGFPPMAGGNGAGGAFPPMAGGNGGGMPQMGGGGFPGGGMPQMAGGFPGGMGQGKPRNKARSGNNAGQGGASEWNMPAMSKDEQDRMLFDGQSLTFLEYFMERFGMEKTRELIAFVREGKETRDFITNSDILGNDFTKIEADWQEWLKKQPLPELPVNPKPKFNNQRRN